MTFLEQATATKDPLTGKVWVYVWRAPRSGAYDGGPEIWLTLEDAWVVLAHICEQDHEPWEHSAWGIDIEHPDFALALAVIEEFKQLRDLWNAELGAHRP